MKATTGKCWFRMHWAIWQHHARAWRKTSWSICSHATWKFMSGSSARPITCHQTWFTSGDGYLKEHPEEAGTWILNPIMTRTHGDRLAQTQDRTPRNRLGNSCGKCCKVRMVPGCRLCCGRAYPLTWHLT